MRKKETEDKNNNNKAGNDEWIGFEELVK